VNELFCISHSSISPNTISFFVHFFRNLFIFISLSIVMRLLFVCNQGKHRSKTAEMLFKDRFETESAGLFSNNPVTEKQISAADTVFVMEDWQRTELSKRFPKQYIQKRIISLNIPDVYQFNQPELVCLLKSRLDESILQIAS
jgi:predicted protein tyrosine phosphatase